VENVARSGAKSAASDAGTGIDQISATGGGLRRDCERTSWPEMEARRRAGLLAPRTEFAFDTSLSASRPKRLSCARAPPDTLSTAEIYPP
jgi:hypothetical protein